MTTRNQALAAASKTLRNGYFHDTTNYKLWVRCQHCGQDIHADSSASRREAARIDALEDALVSHLMEAAA